MNGDEKVSEFRIEFRSSNVGAQGRPGEAATGFAHNFLVLVEVRPDGTTRRVAELNGEPGEDGRLVVVPHPEERGPSKYYADSEHYPKYVLFRGSEKEARERFGVAEKEAEWINEQKITYRTFGNNSNAAAHTMARAAGYNVTAQPADRTGRKPYLEAPSRGIDLRNQFGRPRDPDELIWMERVDGWAHDDTPPSVPIPQIPRHENRRRPERRGEAPATNVPAAYQLGFDNARRFADEHGFDPRLEPKLSQEQNRIISAWVERVLGPAVAHAELPPPLAGDVLDHAARTTPRGAARMLQQGLNRLAGTAEFGVAPPAFADGSAKRVTEDGWIGPETLHATFRHAAEGGLRRVREAVALSGLERGFDALAKGEIGADEAKSVFARSVGRLYRDSNDDISASAAWTAASRPRHRDVSALQSAINDANRIFGFAEEPLVEDGDLGPKTGAALVAAARAAGPSRLADQVGLRLGIGGRGLLDDPARGLRFALDEDTDNSPAVAWG